MAQIFLLHYSSPPVVGGVENVLARQAELMARAGHEVTILTGHGEAWDPRIHVRIVPEIDSRSRRVLEIKSELDRGIVPDDFYALVEDLFKMLRLELVEADWVIAHNVASLHKNLALTAALKRFADEAGPTGIILWHHDFAWNSRRYAGELHAGYPWDLLRTSWPGVLHVTISEARQEEMSQLYKIPADQIKVIPNGVDPAEIHHLSPETRELVDRLELNTANPLLLSPVRLTTRKNLELGLRILAELVHVMPEARWVITGPLGAHNPENKTYYEQLVKLRRKLGLEKTAVILAEIYPDGLSDAQIADFYRISDALLITSQEEGFGLPIIEGGLVRLIIFATDLPSLRALGGAWVTYFRLQDRPADIAARIAQRLSGDPVYRLREHIRANFTWEAIYEHHIAPILNVQTHTEVKR
jgi:mannosylglucosylglycerate synthase